MASKVIEIEGLKRLANDDCFYNQQGRCELYVKMFGDSLFFDVQEYRSLTACTEFSVDRFSR